MTEKAVKSEIQRLKGILEKAGVPEQKRAALEVVILNLAIQRCKLEETAQLLYDEGVICEYDNGGNQKGEHESPLFKGYLNLWRGYLNGLGTYTAALPKEMREEAAGASITVLETVGRMKKKAKA